MAEKTMWCYVTRADWFVDKFRPEQPIKQAVLAQDCIHYSREADSRAHLLPATKAPISLWLFELKDVGQLQEIIEQEQNAIVLYPPADEKEDSYFDIYMLPDGTKLYELMVKDGYID